MNLGPEVQGLSSDATWAHRTPCDSAFGKIRYDHYPPVKLVFCCTTTAFHVFSATTNHVLQGTAVALACWVRWNGIVRVLLMRSKAHQQLHCFAAETYLLPKDLQSAL
jgi:hypothetical protein